VGLHTGGALSGRIQELFAEAEKLAHALRRSSSVEETFVDLG